MFKVNDRNSFEVSDKISFITVTEGLEEKLKRDQVEYNHKGIKLNRRRIIEDYDIGQPSENAMKRRS